MTALKKPLSRAVDRPNMPHGYKDRLILTIHPGGILEVRESRRRESVTLDVGILYVKALLEQARAKTKAKRRSRP